MPVKMDTKPLMLSLKVNRIVSKEEDTTSFMDPDEYEAHLVLEDDFESDLLLEVHEKKWRLLPKEFTQIYLGETFSIYLSLTNDSVQESVSQVTIKIDLQINTKITSLGYIKCESLDAKQKIGEIVHHEVKQLGVHVMICTINYFNADNEEQSFRKFFKFQVFKPLDVKTKFYNAESDEVYLEALLQNLAIIPMCLHQVMLEPSEHFDVKEMNRIKGDDGKEQWVFGERNRFNPMECRQYLFCLTPKKELKEDLELLKSVTVIGKLDILWTSGIGMRGHLQTSSLERMVPNYNDIRLTVEEIPGQVTLKKKFSITFRITNYCDYVMEPCLFIDNKAAEQHVLWLGISGQKMEKLKPLHSIDFKLNSYPIQLGLHPIPRIRISDTILKNNYDFEEIAYVFVNGEAMAHES